MPVVRWDPVREIDSLQGEMNRLFSTFFDTPTNRGGNGTGAARRWIPAMDLVETGEHFVLKADLPGHDRVRREHRAREERPHDRGRAQGRSSRRSTRATTASSARAARSPAR